jgi:DNA repair ATPase RecN
MDNLAELQRTITSLQSMSGTSLVELARTIDESRNIVEGFGQILSDTRKLAEVSRDLYTLNKENINSLYENVDRVGGSFRELSVSTSQIEASTRNISSVVRDLPGSILGISEASSAISGASQNLGSLGPKLERVSENIGNFITSLPRQVEIEREYRNQIQAVFKELQTLAQQTHDINNTQTEFPSIVARVKQEYDSLMVTGVSNLDNAIRGLAVIATLIAENNSTDRKG